MDMRMVCDNILVHYINDVEKLVQDIKFDDTQKDLLVETLREYMSTILSVHETSHPSQKLTAVLIGRMATYFCIMLTKIYYSRHPIGALNSSTYEETTELARSGNVTPSMIVDEKDPAIFMNDTRKIMLQIDRPIIAYAESCTSIATKQIFETRKIGDIEKYLKWIAKTLQLTGIDVIVVSIILRHMCESKNQTAYSWLKNRFDHIIISVIIVARKLYVMDKPYYNHFYSKLFKINIIDINALEIVIILLFNTYIPESEYNSYLDKNYTQYINY